MRLLSHLVPSFLVIVFLILNTTIFSADAITVRAMNSSVTTSTPIKHLIIIFQENVSFDHYFATYPKAVNAAGEPKFIAKAGTPTVNGSYLVSSRRFTTMGDLWEPYMSITSNDTYCSILGKVASKVKYRQSWIRESIP